MKTVYQVNSISVLFWYALYINLHLLSISVWYQFLMMEIAFQIPAFDSQIKPTAFSFIDLIITFVMKLFCFVTSDFKWVFNHIFCNGFNKNIGHKMHSCLKIYFQLVIKQSRAGEKVWFVKNNWLCYNNLQNFLKLYHHHLL